VAQAMEAMIDEDMSAAVAQDGVNISVRLPSARLSIDSIALRDVDGITFNSATNFTGYNNRGDLLLQTLQLQACTEATTGGACTAVTTSDTFNINVDSDGGVSGLSPTIQAKINIGSAVNKLRFSLDKISMRGGASGTTVALIDMSTVDIVPVGSKNLLTVQLGAQPQGGMIKFTNANFGTLDFGTIKILDKSDTVNGGACATCNINFNFAISSLNFTNATLDISNAGLVFNLPSFATPINVTMQNVQMGNTTSMGSFGAQSLQVSNLQLAISGM